MTIVECQEGDIPFKIENHDPGKSGDYVFEPKEMEFKAGDAVCLVLSAETEAHTFTVDELGIDVDLNPGEVVRHRYVFDERASSGCTASPTRRWGWWEPSPSRPSAPARGPSGGVGPRLTCWLGWLYTLR